jgi:hypothetical protein
MKPCTGVSATVHFNNVGAQCIENGEYTRAIGYLSAAFQSSKSQIDRNHRMLLGEIAPAVPPPSTCTVDIWMATGIPAETHDGFIYRHPIYIPTEAQPNGMIVAVATIITFNLGLAYHLLAFRDGAFLLDPMKILRQALNLYQYTFRLQRAQRESTQSPFFFMATINNIGILFSKLGDSVHAEECFHHLMSLLMYIKTTIGLFGHPSYYEGFFRNTFHSCSVVGAAAA